MTPTLLAFFLAASLVFAVRLSDIKPTWQPVIDFEQARQMQARTIDGSDLGCMQVVESRMAIRGADLPGGVPSIRSANATKISNDEYLYQCWDIRKDMRPTIENPEIRNLGWWKGKCPSYLVLHLTDNPWPQILQNEALWPLALQSEARQAYCFLPPRRKPTTQCVDGVQPLVQFGRPMEFWSSESSSMAVNTDQISN